MFLTFRFTETFKLNLTACCVVLKIWAYLHILIFMMEKKNKKWRLAEKEFSKSFVTVFQNYLLPATLRYYIK